MYFVSLRDSVRPQDTVLIAHAGPCAPASLTQTRTCSAVGCAIRRGIQQQRQQQHIHRRRFFLWPPHTCSTKCFARCSGREWVASRCMWTPPEAKAETEGNEMHAIRRPACIEKQTLGCPNSRLTAAHQADDSCRRNEHWRAAHQLLVTLPPAKHAD